MIKRYKFDYDFSKAVAEFEIDTEMFTPEIANATLQFFLWEYDKEADPVSEVLKKYALEAIREATFNNHNTKGVIGDFKVKEGFAPIDGNLGLLLTYVEGFEFEENDLTVEIS